MTTAANPLHSSSTYGSPGLGAANSGSLPEEIPFDALHLELIQRAISASEGAQRERALADLELLGFNAGFRLIEKLTKESPKFKDELDLMKFVCKEFWMAVFRKQIDNLRTNHQGVYVLQDNQFKFLAKVSQGPQHLEHAPKFVVFTCGLLRGSLANLGVNSVVTAEVANLPSVKFQIQVQRA